MSEQCASCKSSRLEAASLFSAALVLQRASGWKKATSGAVEVTCRVCLDCGVIDRLMAADLEKLAKSVPAE
ncbi:MAG: hypothetical protein H0V17_33330 [Deltaproteobacteria bacterium]|nr:hypothetical protein [Deltaproteobacteria bacterium]